MSPFLVCWYIGGQCPWLKDCPQTFTVALEASLLGQLFISASGFPSGYTSHAPEGFNFLTILCPIWYPAVVRFYRREQNMKRNHIFRL